MSTDRATVANLQRESRHAMNRLFCMLVALIAILSGETLHSQPIRAGGGNARAGTSADGRDAQAYCGSDQMRARNSGPETVAREKRIDRLLYDLLRVHDK